MNNRLGNDSGKKEYPRVAMVWQKGKDDSIGRAAVNIYTPKREPGTTTLAIL
jgi:hypothetical protein